MDALELLKDDHRKIRALFEEARTGETIKHRRTTFNSIKYELEAHAFIEEGIFYPTFRKEELFTEIVKKSFEDHQLIKNLLREIDEMGSVIGRAGEAQFDEKMAFLQMTAETHIREEELRFFPMVRKAMRLSDRDRLGKLMQATRDELEWAA